MSSSLAVVIPLSLPACWGLRVAELTALLWLPSRRPETQKLGLCLGAND